MLTLPFQINPNELKLIEDEVLLRSLQQYREALELIDGHDEELASKFAEIVEQHEAEAKRRGPGLKALPSRRSSAEAETRPVLASRSLDSTENTPDNYAARNEVKRSIPRK